SAAPIQETPFRSVRLGPSWLCRPCSFDSTTREHLNHRRAQVVEPTTCAQSARRGPPLPQFLFSGMAGWHVAALSATSSLRSATAPRSPPRCPTTTSARPSASLPSRPPRPHNQPNRRVRTRMHGGVGGEGPRGSPLIPMCAKSSQSPPPASAPAQPSPAVKRLLSIKGCWSENFCMLGITLEGEAKYAHSLTIA